MGGVFISYRSVDNPLGAATIREYLAGQFGEQNVFRDRESLEPGRHYPTDLQAALDNADVLVAVIGPRWLSLLKKDNTGLVEPEFDWVRHELRTAFGRGIYVMPVLLKDTPEDARMPTTAELPDDIRKLVGFGSVTMSQRQLTADLTSIGAAVALRPGSACPDTTRALRASSYRCACRQFRPLRCIYSAAEQLTRAGYRIPTSATQCLNRRSDYDKWLGHHRTGTIGRGVRPDPVTDKWIHRRACDRYQRAIYSS